MQILFYYVLQHVTNYYLISFVEGLRPSVSEAHCGHTSLHKYVITILICTFSKHLTTCRNLVKKYLEDISSAHFLISSHSSWCIIIIFLWHFYYGAILRPKNFFNTFLSLSLSVIQNLSNPMASPHPQTHTQTAPYQNIIFSKTEKKSHQMWRPVCSQGWPSHPTYCMVGILHV